jgi:hypothetical protein
MRILTPAAPEFREYWELLVARSRLAPVYSSSHLHYYECATGVDVVADFAAVVVHREEVVAGTRLMLRASGDGQVLDYFGMPAPVVLPSVVDSESAEAANSLAQHLYRLGLRSYLRDGATEFKVTLPILGSRGSELAEVLFEASDRVYVDLMRVVEFGGAAADGPRRTKSVKAALKTAADKGLVTHVVDKSSSIQEIRQGLTDLQTLHLSAAGRLTRSPASWDEQRESIERGSAFLVIGTLDGQVIGAALFLTAGPSAYYGVSANSVHHRHLSLSHVLVSEAIAYLGRNSYERLFLGNQFSQKTRQVSAKEVQIENFKSLFGGRTTYNLVAEASRR